MQDYKPSINSLGVVIIFFALLFVFSKWGPAIPFSVLSQSKGEPMVVIGEGKATAVPDIAKVSAGIEESGVSLSQVQDSVNKKSQSLVAALKKLGIDDKDIKTTAYNIYPVSDYESRPPKITGYQVSINYEVTIKDIDKVNDALVTITGAGANLVGNVSFDLSDEAEDKALGEARANAVDKAKRNAESLAKASGVTLGKIINISEDQIGGPRPVVMFDKAVSAGGTEPAPPEVTPGTTEINLTVSLSYEIR